MIISVKGGIFFQSGSPPPFFWNFNAHKILILSKDLFLICCS